MANPNPTYTTRIMDLPDPINNPIASTEPNHSMPQPPGNAIGSTTYTPIDNHPNPYGHPPPSVPMVPPTPSHNDNMRIQQSMEEQLQQLPTQSLPNRDIPMMNESYTHDEQIQQNYIPPVPEPVKRTTEYIKQYDEATERKIQAHQDVKEKQSRMDILIEKGQIPLLVAVLFFIFHMPILNVYVFNRLSFLSIYSDDGHFNTYGLIMKSILFGSVFYSLSQAIQWLSEF